jgi:glutamate-ammonia-ligase adenylyltransferase
MTRTPPQLFLQVPQSLRSLVENYWQDWSAACENNDIIFQSDLPLELLGRTWACSDFVARNCIRYPKIFHEMYQEDFQSSRTFNDYQQLVTQVTQSAGDDKLLMKALRVLRQKEMLRIAWRDLNALAAGETILHELSDFSEAVVLITLRQLEKQQAKIHGMPCDADGEALELLTFAMGKMGGRELNFSSDIDLIFAFPEDGETSGPRRTSHGEFYLSVVRKLVKVLNEVTVDGFVYRVDTRLRPFGESGPMVISFSGMEQYYQLQGRDWERYAMIKAKLITGRKADRDYLQSMLSPFVYRRYLDFSMLESIREMKAMINAQMKRKRMTNNIKLGRGGIREIEFIGQTLQLIRAGREPELRERSIVKVLSLLAEKRYLQKEEVGKLLEAYWFLRKLENRLQMQRDMQIHVLPEDEELQQRLCLAMGMPDWEELLSQLAQHQHNVDQVFENIIAHDTTETESLPFSLLWEDDDTSDDLYDFLINAGYTDTDTILKSLSELRESPQVKAQTGDNRRRLEKLLASLITQIATYPQQYELLDRVSRIVKALVGRKVYISLLTEFPLAQQQMLKLCAASEWFTERLLKHPILLDGLLVSKEILQQQYDQKHLLGLELNRIDSHSLAESDLEQVMDRMRQFKRQAVFNVAVIDVFYEEPVETVSDRLTELANVLLEKILELSWETMVAKYGTPECIVDGVIFQPTMSIVAYGKMGGNELGYGSDLDIIFLHNSSGEKQNTTGEKVLDNQHFFARVAQRVIHFLNTRTYSGILYEADTRLRPNGQSGLMVSSISAFETYQREKAWTWEHQALIRARFVTGSALIEQEFDRIRSSVLRQSRETTQLLLDVVKMREKMRKHLANKAAGFDFKQDAGGLVDIEFMTQAGVLIHAERYADCIAHTATLELINELTKVGWYEAAEAEDIASAYRYFRQLKNWQNLECENDVSKAGQYCENVVAVWNRLMPEVSQGAE